MGDGMEIKSSFRYRAIRFDGYKEERWGRGQGSFRSSRKSSTRTRHSAWKVIANFFFHDRSIDRSLSIKDPRQSVISFVSKFGKKVAVRSLVEKSNFNLIPRDWRGADTRGWDEGAKIDEKAWRVHFGNKKSFVGACKIGYGYGFHCRWFKSLQALFIGTFFENFTIKNLMLLRKL